jgi:MFS family permease
MAASDVGFSRKPSEGSSRLPTTKTAWGIVVLLVVFTIVNYADRAVLALAALPIMRELGLSAQQFGLISSSFFFLHSISAITVAWVATKIAPRWLLLIMGMLWALTQAPVFLVGGVGILFVNRIVLGAAEGPASPLAYAVAHSWFPAERRGLPSSLISGGAPLAKILVAPVLVLIILNAGWRTAFLVLAMVGIGWTAAWLVLGRAGPYTATSVAAATAVPDRTYRRGTFGRALLNRTFLGLLLATFPMYGLTTVIVSWMPTYLESGLHFSPLQSGFLYGLPSISSIVLMLFSGAVTDRLLRRGVSHRIAHGAFPTLALALGGALVALLPGVAEENRWVALVMLTAGYGLGNLAIPISYAAVGTLAEPSQRASVLSVFIALQTFSGVIAPWLTGVFVDAGRTAVDGYNRAFIVIGIAIVVAAVIGAVLVDPARDDVTSGA